MSIVIHSLWRHVVCEGFFLIWFYKFSLIISLILSTCIHQLCAWCTGGSVWSWTGQLYLWYMVWLADFIANTLCYMIGLHVQTLNRICAVPYTRCTLVGPYEVGTLLIAVHKFLLSTSICESFLHVQTTVFLYQDSFGGLCKLFLGCPLLCEYLVVPSFNYYRWVIFYFCLFILC